MSFFMGAVASGRKVASADAITALMHSRWKANYGVTIATGVSSWADMVSGRTLVQATAANQPTVVTPTELGSKSALRFDGVNDRLISTDPAEDWKFLHDGTGMEVIAVLVSRFVDGSGSGGRFPIIATHALAAADPGIHLAEIPNASTLRLGIHGASAIVTASIAGTMTVDTAKVVNASYVEGGSPEYRLKATGATLVSGSSGSAPSSSDPTGTLHVGCITTLANFLQMDLAELLIRNSVLSSGDRTTVTDYIAAEYGVAA